MEQYSGILLDAYGVFWGGNAAGLLPGSMEMMKKLVSGGKIVGILSNSTQLAAKETQKLQKAGLNLNEHFHFLLTSGEVVRKTFLKGELLYKKFWLFGGVHPKFSSHEAIFEGTAYSETSHIEDADFIYVSVPHINGEDQEDPEAFKEKIQEILTHDLPMVCPNPDQFAHEGNPPRAVVRQGTIARIYEELGGEVIYIGKPHKKVYVEALENFSRLGISDPAEILMIGDTPETDIRGAKRVGMASALTLETGIMGDRISRTDKESALKMLPQIDIPDYYIERFACLMKR